MFDGICRLTSSLPVTLPPLCLLQEHIFKLMKSDSYARFLRSNIYQDLLLARKKVSCTRLLMSLHHLNFISVALIHFVGLIFNIFM